MIRCLLSALLICSAAFAQVQSPIVVTNTAQLAAFNVGTVKAAILVSTNGNVEFAYDKNATTATNTSTTDPIIGSVSGGRWFGKQVGSGGAGVGALLSANNLSDVANVSTSRSNLVAETRRTFNVLDYFPPGTSPGTNSAIDTLAIRAGIAAGGTNATIVFPSTNTFLIGSTLEMRQGQTWIMYGAKLKRADEVTVNFSTAIATNTDPVTITVASTNGFWVGMDVSVFNGSNFDASRHRITAMTATTIRFNGNFTTAFPTGGTLVTAFDTIDTRFGGLTQENVHIFGGEIDGNQANNSSLQKWQLNGEIYFASDNASVRDVYIHDAQSEGILFAGDNSIVEHNRIENCQGNGIHVFGCYNPTVRNCVVKHCNQSGTATGHADGCIIFSNVTSDCHIEDNWVEDGISGIGSIDSVDNSRIWISGNVITNFTTAIDMILPSGFVAGEVTITGNKFYNAGEIKITGDSSTPASTNQPKNVIMSGNMLFDTTVTATVVSGLNMSGNIISNSTTTAFVVMATDCKDFKGSDQITGGRYGYFFQTQLASGSGTNAENVLVANAILRNQYSGGIWFQNNIINAAARNNAIIAKAGSVNAAAWVGITLGDGTLAEGNSIYAESGLYGIQLPNGLTGAGGRAFRNMVITTNGMITIEAFGGSSKNYIDGNLVSSAISNSSTTNNFIGFNRIIGEQLRTGTGLMVASTAPSITNAVLITPNIGDATGTGLNVSGNLTAANDVTGLNGVFNNFVSTSTLNLPIGASPTTDQFGEIAGDNNAWASGRGAVQFFDGTANTYLVGVLSSDTPTNGQVPTWNTGGIITWETPSSSGGDVTAASTFGTDNRLIRSDGTGKGVQGSSVDVDDSGNISTPGTITSGSSGGAGGVAWSDGGSHWFRISPPTLSTDYNLIPDTSPSTGFWLETVSGTNGTITKVGSTGSGNVARATSPTFVTPTLGAATATSINKVALTAPASGATITVADGKTLAVNKSITLDGTDSTTITLPASTASVLSTASGEINALTAKTTPASSDLIVIEDSAASNAKKKITYANFTSGLGGGGTSVYVNGASVSNPNFIGGQFDVNTSTNIVIKSAAAITNVVNSGKVTLTDAATIATDASLGNSFQVTLGGNRTLGNPTNGKNGQKCIWELIQDGTGSRTIAMDTKFAFGTDITGITLTTTASKRDFITAQYDSTADKWYVVGFVRGY